ncbi:3-deoxy-D-manno-octulosonic acid transferase [Marinifilum caeruleilacunae]|uniref:3-deoxy-D-manno-octulosonic acid transferase n=1 Tax=Marinifilum caeruleilacunae TaxID=2499076 RepID=A0ABX1WXV8_9BACT|nr:glycosyltransferase N-terminal domain-containing protein [Marinifilum caeruleilacunae]NOU60831.1 3-deoxy-D-manno-octulosonic acid transferase [Marinifilum caeruleilacunae]
MVLFYNLSIRMYVLLVRIAAFFNPKAKQWVDGRKNLFTKLEEAVKGEENIVWFHSASLGEFEQGRPVIESFKEQYPEYKILLTFFSPSGYEVRKNYEGADYIFYLPADFASNAKRFMNIVQPKMAFFIKYEFWHHYLKELKKRNVPTYIFSTIFRPNQLFFKGYGGFYKKMLTAFTHLFVQNQESVDLLKGIGFSNVTLTGDTRFDRVYTIATGSKSLPKVEDFAQGREVLIAGSTWPKDEENITRYINQSKNSYKYIIAAHEVDEDHINNITAKIEKSWVRYTKATKEQIDAAEVLVIDCIGVLSSLYRYGSVSYIGGGFGRGIHNTLEAATFGLPVIFGPNYHKFQEAKDLIEIGASKSYENYEELENLLDLFYNNQEDKETAGEKSKNYVDKMRGASAKILSEIKV